MIAEEGIKMTAEDRIKELERKIENLEYLLLNFSRRQITAFQEAQETVENYLRSEQS